MKPNPLSSLNHFTVPVGICGNSSTVCECCYAEDAAQSLDLRALALLSPVFSPARHNDRSRSLPGNVVEMLQPGGSGIMPCPARHGRLGWVDGSRRRVESPAPGGEATPAAAPAAPRRSGY